MSITIRIKRGVGTPSTLKQGELAFDETGQRLFIGSGVGTGGNAASVVELTTPPAVLEDLANISVGSGAADGDVLVYDGDTAEWVAQAITASSVAWDDVTSKPTFATVATTGDYDDLTGKPTSLTPTAHKASHATGGADALSPADIGAAASSHTHAASDITSGLATVATTGAYADLSGTPTLGTAAASASTDFVAASAVSAFGENLISEESAESARTTLGLGSAATSATSAFAAATHSHAWADITSGVPSDFTPSSHTHGSISNDGKIGSTAGLVVQTGASGALSTLTAGTSGQILMQGSSGLEWGTAGGVGTVTSVTAGTGLSGGTIESSGTIAVTYGTTASTACEGNDARLSDTRTPTDNTVSTAKLQDGAVTYAKIQDVSATDKILGRATAGAGDVEEITCTAAGRAILDDADAAAQRTTLGLGTAATSASTDFVAASALSTFGENFLSEESEESARYSLGIGSAGTFASSHFALATHSHAWSDITSGVPSSFTPSAHNHAVTLEISGFIESPEAKTYVLSPAIPAAITITQFKAQTSAGTVDLAVHDDGTLVTGCSLADAGTTLAELASAISESVAAGSKLALVVSDLQSSPADLAFTVHYTVASANNT
jgi:hypothetical protein